MHRRSFLTLLGGAAAAWPLRAGAQQRERMRRIGVLMVTDADDPESQAYNAAFLQALQELGWTVGRNLQVEHRWAGGDADRIRSYARELVALGPEMILAGGGTVGALRQATQTVPIVFSGLIDPVGSGYVASLPRPGGNVTGFTPFEYGLSGKWLELLKQIAPRVTQVAVFRDSAAPTGSGLAQYAAIQAVAPAFGVELRPIDVRDASEIERAVTAFARATNGGLIVTSSSAVEFRRELIIALAARHQLPAVYPFRTFVTGGGLISYGPDRVDRFRRAAGYVDRILRGERPADLPVQAPVKYETVFNMKTAKALGLDVPATVLVRATEVIE